MASYLSLGVKFNLTVEGLCWDLQELHEKYVRAKGVLEGKEGGEKNSLGVKGELGIVVRCHSDVLIVPTAPAGFLTEVCLSRGSCSF